MTARRRTLRVRAAQALFVVLAAALISLLVGTLTGLLFGWGRARDAYGFVFLLGMITLPLHLVLRPRMERFFNKHGLGPE